MSLNRGRTRSAIGASAVFLVLLGALYALVSFSGRSPVIESIEPVAAQPGQQITIQGAHFGESRGRARVRISGTVPTSSAYLEWSDERIVLTVPEDVTSGLAYVETDRGRSNGVLFANARHLPQAEAESASSARPRIDSLQPEAVAVGEVLTIRGIRFGENRNDARVSFAWESVDGRQGRIDVSPAEEGYEYWSGREVRVRVPDGAASGEVVVETARGQSDGVPVELAYPVGRKLYGDRQSHALSVRVTVDSVQLAEGGTEGAIYLWSPEIATSPEQRNHQILTRSAQPLFSPIEGVSLYRLRGLQPDSEWSLRRSELFERYAIETRIDSPAVPRGYEQSEQFMRRFTQANELLPVDAPPIEAVASELRRFSNNPYVRARRTYDYVVSNLEPSSAVGAVSAVEALQSGRANAQGYATLLVSLLRGQGIPARLVGGYLVGEGNVTHRHYWSEFYLDSFGWVPADPAVADGAAMAELPLPEDPAEFYFGNLDASRFAFSKGFTRVPHMHPEGRVHRVETMYSLQSHHQEVVGDIAWYRVRWHDVEYLGEY